MIISKYIFMVCIMMNYKNCKRRSLLKCWVEFRTEMHCICKALLTIYSVSKSVTNLLWKIRLVQYQAYPPVRESQTKDVLTLVDNRPVLEEGSPGHLPSWDSLCLAQSVQLDRYCLWAVAVGDYTLAGTELFVHPGQIAKRFRSTHREV